MAEDQSEIRGFDAVRLIALVREGNEDAITEAYRRTYGSDLGRLVLAHHAAECGVGQVFGASATSEERHYVAGQHDAAIRLMSAAGYDQATAVVMVLTDQLEPRTQTDDRSDPGRGHELGEHDELP